MGKLVDSMIQRYERTVRSYYPPSEAEGMIAEAHVYALRPNTRAEFRYWSSLLEELAQGLSLEEEEKEARCASFASR